jgi:hypothetical protein
MENRPIITITGRSPAAGAEKDDYQRYRKWADEVYGPLIIRAPESVDNDTYEIYQANPQYPRHIHILHYKTLIAREISNKTSLSKDIDRERIAWDKRGVVDSLWNVTYAMIKSFRSQPVYSTDNKDTRIENMPIMHLEAYSLSREEQERYLNWFAGFGSDVFMPIFMKFPGVAGFDFFKDTGLRRAPFSEKHYPTLLSIIYFKSTEAFNDFTNSPELAGFLKATKNVFGRRLTYEWYVQYQLVKSWRK